MVVNYSKSEQNVARHLSRRFKYIARDKCGILVAYEERPVKNIVDEEWVPYMSTKFEPIDEDIASNMFFDITFDDDFPVLLEDIYK